MHTVEAVPALRVTCDDGTHHGAVGSIVFRAWAKTGSGLRQWLFEAQALKWVAADELGGQALLPADRPIIEALNSH